MITEETMSIAIFKLPLKSLSFLDADCLSQRNRQIDAV